MFGLFDHSSVHGKTSQSGCIHPAISVREHCGNQELELSCNTQIQTMDPENLYVVVMTFDTNFLPIQNMTWYNHDKEHMTECSNYIKTYDLV